MHRSLPLYIGAVKSNVGHLEAASGVASVIKTVLALEKAIIPPNIWFEKLNPKISQAWNLIFPTEAVPWPTKGLRRASINSFGFGGSNCHCILDDAYNYLQMHNLDGLHSTEATPPPSATERCNVSNMNGTLEAMSPNLDSTSQLTLLVWSSCDEGGTGRIANSLSHFAHSREDRGKPFLNDLAYTLCEKRSALAWRSCAVVSSLQDVSQNLLAKISKPMLSAERVGLIFVFTGQGAQWPGMGIELMRYDIFRESLQNAEFYLKSLGCEWSLMGKL